MDHAESDMLLVCPSHRVILAALNFSFMMVIHSNELMRHLKIAYFWTVQHIKLAP